MQVFHLQNTLFYFIFLNFKDMLFFLNFKIFNSYMRSQT